MGSFIDTHAHLVDPAFSSNLEEVVQRAKERGVGGIVLIGSGYGKDGNFKSASLARKDRFFFRYTVGVHPHDASSLPFSYIEELKEFLKDPLCAGVGECGLDFYRDPSPEEKEKQHSWFHLQCELAIQYSKPLIVHTRSAWKETVEILKQHRIGRKTPGVIHFFSGTLHEAEEVLKEGVHLSVTGVVTFPRSDRLREVIKTIPLSSLMVETDSPYATPVPYRGKRNEPAFLVEIVQKIAEIRSLPLQEVSEVLWRTSKEFFRFYPG